MERNHGLRFVSVLCARYRLTLRQQAGRFGTLRETVSLLEAAEGTGFSAASLCFNIGLILDINGDARQSLARILSERQAAMIDNFTEFSSPRTVGSLS